MKFGANINKFTTVVVFLLLACHLLLFPASAAAQNTVDIELMRVDIWPEYDKPSVLVIYHITLSPETTLPANMIVRIPSSVGPPHAVAMQDPNGLYNLNYDLVPGGEWEEIQFTTPVPEVRIEYYDPGLKKSGNTRIYSFNFAVDYAVHNLSLMVQQPAGATNMVLAPSMGSGAQAEDGLVYFTYMAGKVNPGTTFSVSLSYDKADDTLTSASQFQPVQPSEPVIESVAGRINWGQVLPWTLGGLGLLLIAAGLFYYFGPRHAQQKIPRRRHISGKVVENNHQEGPFCHNCGKRATPGDIYCRTCGTKLK